MVSSSKPAISSGATRAHASRSDRSPDAHGRKPRDGAVSAAAPAADGTAAWARAAAGGVHGTDPAKRGS